MGVPKTQVSVLVPWRNGLKASRTRLFSSFFVKYVFAIFDDFSKLRKCDKKIINYGRQKIGKKAILLT